VSTQTFIDIFSLLTEQEIPNPLEKEAPPDTDISYADSLRRLYWDKTKELPAKPLRGIIQPSSLPTRYRIHSHEYWDFTLIRKSKPYPLPEVIREKLCRAQEVGIPFKWFIWVEQHIIPPEIKILPRETVYVVKEVFVYIPRIVGSRFDPMLLGLIACGKDAGIPYLLGSWEHESSMLSWTRTTPIS